jgi:hypothetical protein
MGIMTLAVLALMGLTDIYEMNALKSLLVVLINGAGVGVFVSRGMTLYFFFKAYGPG